MKANAPEKIYIDDFGSELSHDWHTEHSYENDIEYIRKDAFIEKAEKWLLGFMECSPLFEYQVSESEQKETIDDFKNYMRGE